MICLENEQYFSPKRGKVRPEHTLEIIFGPCWTYKVQARLTSKMGTVLGIYNRPRQPGPMSNTDMKDRPSPGDRSKGCLVSGDHGLKHPGPGALLSMKLIGSGAHRRPGIVDPVTCKTHA